MKLPDDIDPHILNLVQAMNEIPDLTTIGSCGGHTDPSPCQWEAGTFYVNFEIPWSPQGEDALRKLGSAIDEPPPPFTAFENISIDVWTHGDPRFAVHGFDNADPDELAASIRATLAQWEDGWGL